MSAARVAAVIPNWNGAAFLDRCLASLAQQSTGRLEVIVVDNGSTDNSAAVAERSGARLIGLDRNYGFAYAVNRGIEASDAEFIAVVNNDVELQPGWLAALLEALAANPDCGMVTGRTLIRGRDAILDGAGDALSLGFAAARLGFGLPDGPAYREPRAVLAVSGAASLFRRHVFEKAGMLEEQFFAYLEDVELCLRAQLAGFRAMYVPQAVACHVVSGSSGGIGTDSRPHPRVARWMTAHQLLVAARYTRWGTLRVVLPRLLLIQALWAGHLWRAGRFLDWLAGVGIAFQGFGRMRRWRFPPGAGPSRLLELLRFSESQILADRGAHDRFWRLYFRVFPAVPASSRPPV